MEIQHFLDVKNVMIFVNYALELLNLNAMLAMIHIFYLEQRARTLVQMENIKILHSIFVQIV